MVNHQITIWDNFSTNIKRIIMAARLPYNHNVFWQTLPILLSLYTKYEAKNREVSQCVVPIPTTLPEHCSLWSDQVHKNAVSVCPASNNRTLLYKTKKKYIKNERLGVIHQRRRMMANAAEQTHRTRHTRRSTPRNRFRVCGRHWARGGKTDRAGTDTNQHVHLLQQSWQHTEHTLLCANDVCGRRPDRRRLRLWKRVAAKLVATLTIEDNVRTKVRRCHRRRDSRRSYAIRRRQRAHTPTTPTRNKTKLKNIILRTV